MAKVELTPKMKGDALIALIVILILGGIAYQWSYTEDYNTFYKDGRIIARSSVEIHMNRVYSNIKYSYQKANCIRDGGEIKGSRCYYPDNFYKKLTKKRNTISFYSEELEDEYVIHRETSYNKYGTSGKTAGTLHESIIHDKDVVKIEEFPKKYNINYEPKDNALYKIVWKVTDLKNMNLPVGIYDSNSYSFGEMKVSVPNAVFDYAEVIDSDTILFYFKPTRGLQNFDLTLVDPWLIGYSYRKEHNISSATGAGENYQMLFLVNRSSGIDLGETVYVNGNCTTDFADIRFTESDGVTELDYWMEGTSNDAAMFWVEVSGNLTASQQTVYIYYNNTGASTTSSGANTFLFFDDFSDGNLDEYNVQPATLSASIPVGSTWLSTVGTVDTDNGAVISRVQMPSNYRGKFQFVNRSGFHPDAYGGIGTCNSTHMILGQKRIDGADDDNFFRIIKSPLDAGVEWQDYNTGNPTTNVTEYDTQEFTRFTNIGNQTARNFDVILHFSWSYTHDDIALNLGNASLGGPWDDRWNYYNWTFFANYTSPEPAHGNWGTAESNVSVPPTYIVITTDRPRNPEYTTTVLINGTTNEAANVTYVLDGGSETSICNLCLQYNVTTTIANGTNRNMTIYATDSTNSSNTDNEEQIFNVTIPYISIWLHSDLHSAGQFDSGGLTGWQRYNNSIDQVATDFDANMSFIAGDIVSDGETAADFTEVSNSWIRGDIPTANFSTVAGNHDFQDDGTLDNYNTGLSPPDAYNYTTSIDNNIFIFISDGKNSMAGEMTTGQELFLNQTVKNNQDKNIFVTTHHCLNNTIYRSTETGYSLNNTATLEILLTNYNVTTWFCGHIHPHNSTEDGAMDIKFGTLHVNIAAIANYSQSITADVNSRILQFESDSKNMTFLHLNHSGNVQVPFKDPLNNSVWNYTYTMQYLFSGVEPAPILIKNASFLGVNFDVANFTFSSTSYVNAFVLDFNTSELSTDFILMTSMNLVKESGGAERTITTKILVDDVEVNENTLRTLQNIEDVGSTGDNYANFTVANGVHNLTYQVKTTGDSISMTNIDVNLGQFRTTSAGNVTSDLVSVDTIFTHTIADWAFNWTMNKGQNSTTFIAAKINQQSDENDNIITCDIRNTVDGEKHSAYWQRWLSSTSDVGSASISTVDEDDKATSEHGLYCGQSQTANVILNGSIINFDMTDSESFIVNEFTGSNSDTNITSNLTYAAGMHNIFNETITIANGTGMFLSATTSFKSNSGKQTPMYFVNSTNVSEVNCFSQKSRWLSSSINKDIGNVFIYTICDGLTVDNDYNFNLWLVVETGETIIQLDEALSGFEVTAFDTATSNTAPIVSITAPVNNPFVSGTQNITWITTDLQVDNFVSNVTLVNTTEIVVLEDNIVNTTDYLEVNFDLYPLGLYNISVESCENATSDLLCGSDVVQIYTGGDCTMFANFTQGENIVCNNLTTDTFTWDVSIYNLTVTDFAEVNGTLDASSGDEITLGSLVINSGVYNATSGTTKITSESNDYAFNNDGTLNANSGLINITTSATTLIDMKGTVAGNIYNLEIAGTDVSFTTDAQTIDNDLIITSGRFQPNTAASRDLTVTGDVDITGILGGNSWSSDLSVGTLTINSGGLYEATSGTSTIIDADNNLGLENNGNFIHNQGLVEFNDTSWAAIEGNSVTTFYNLNCSPTFDTYITDPIIVINKFTELGREMRLISDSSLTLGNGSQAGSFIGGMEIVGWKAQNKAMYINGSSSSYPAILEDGGDTWHWNSPQSATEHDILLSNVDIRSDLDTSQGDGGITNIILLGNSEFDAVSVASTHTFDLNKFTGTFSDAITPTGTFQGSYSILNLTGGSTSFTKSLNLTELNIYSGAEFNLTSGNTLTFNDSAGAGFGVSSGTINFLGVLAGNVTVQSVNSPPSNRWTINASTWSAYEWNYTAVSDGEALASVEMVVLGWNVTGAHAYWNFTIPVATTSVPSDSWFDLNFQPPWNSSLVVYSLGFETNGSAGSEIVPQTAASVGSANASIGNLVAPNAIAYWDTGNQVVKDYFGNIPALPIVYNRNYSVMFMFNVSSINGNYVKIPINITHKMDAYSGNWTERETLYTDSLLLTAGTIFGGILNDTTTSGYEIPYYVTVFSG